MLVVLNDCNTKSYRGQRRKRIQGVARGDTPPSPSPARGKRATGMRCPPRTVVNTKRRTSLIIDFLTREAKEGKAGAGCVSRVYCLRIVLSFCTLSISLSLILSSSHPLISVLVHFHSSLSPGPLLQAARPDIPSRRSSDNREIGINNHRIQKLECETRQLGGSFD